MKVSGEEWGRMHVIHMDDRQIGELVAFCETSERPGSEPIFYFLGQDGVLFHFLKWV